MILLICIAERRHLRYWAEGVQAVSYRLGGAYDGFMYDVFATYLLIACPDETRLGFPKCRPAIPSRSNSHLSLMRFCL